MQSTHDFPVTSPRRPKLARIFGFCMFAAMASAEVLSQDFASLAGGVMRIPSAVDEIVGDLNGDKIPDFVAFTAKAVYYASGERGFARRSLRVLRRPRYSSGTTSSTGALGDFNGDGRVDVFCAKSADPLRKQQAALLLQQQDGSFREAAAIRDPNPDPTGVVRVLDINRDGKLDVYLGKRTLLARKDVLLLGDGMGSFRDASGILPNRTHDTRDVCFADLDGDGDLDIVKANYRQLDTIYRNDGARGFRDVAGLPSRTTASVAVAAGDRDGDGDIDLVFAAEPGNQEHDRLLDNNGRGVFREVALPRKTTSTCIHMVDLDGDGDLDILRGSTSDASIFENLGGSRAFVERQAFAQGLDLPRMHLVDIDGDGDLDLAQRAACLPSALRAGTR